ncbi:ankyrin repeat domain-containing protein [Bradyrhizobium sp. 2TAF24]|uniref:ankyrin repeat domain-containing protein n=1 Tax=Bradyrhizobium sp. 2TAF24 TaxID=3233011 RepID=UPI003F8EB893
MDALISAIIEQDREAFGRLLRPGMDLNYICARGAPIHWASLIGNVEFVRTLLQFGADPNMRDPDFGQNAVHKAADQSVEIVTALHAAGANVDLPDTTGMTPLMIAARGGKLDIVRFFVEHGAHVRAADDHATNPLHWSAVGGNFPDVNAYLIQAGADPAAVTSYNMTYDQILALTIARGLSSV